ncbi:type II toxin-antitoxin system RelE/ParE family toxin [Vibrio mediterranei]|uniref:type II toxin-antitoxin system RelE/ParE family toxin n=1 Tax=Vibrio mediterranei TaxID=689 RepID=UPI001EFE8E45|nr:type II toxin-antitoxin system RelE/ParE family toxin [Vibrio mediterranei]MCG9657627.1 type II toxin-antitoxin system RelE/ParE family toxin [Vibrio mediterranei]
MNKKQTLTIDYTDTFEQLLDQLIAYLRDFSSELAVIERIEALLDRFESQVTFDPLSVAVCPSLLELGVAQFREFHADGFRVIFRVFELPTGGSRVVVDVIAQQQQNLEHLLVQHCLLHR